jgi:hypothetical protein
MIDYVHESRSLSFAAKFDNSLSRGGVVSAVIQESVASEILADDARAVAVRAVGAGLIPQPHKRSG